MATKSPGASDRAQQKLSSKSFFAKHNDLVAELFRTPGRKRLDSLVEMATATIGTMPPTMSRFLTAVEQLEKGGFSRMLEAAKQENSPEAFKKTLGILIQFLGVETPRGVFTPSPRTGKPGRPISSESERIHSTWIKIGKPSLFKNELAQAFYRAEFTIASGTGRRKMRDRCRHAVERHVERQLANQVAKLEKELADRRKETAELRERLPGLK